MTDDIGKVLKKIKPADLVLDVGGCTKPLARADWVLDIVPYKERGKKGLIGEGPERFTEKTWVVHDICSRQPWPFADKQFDFIFCSHTLEDLKDPSWVCSEMIRVGKRGYIETPSRWQESKRGVGGKLKYPRKLAGYFNHAWFVEEIDDILTFTTKTPFIHILKDFQTKDNHPEILSFFWEENFKYQERPILSLQQAIDDLLHFKLKEIEEQNQKQRLIKKAQKILALSIKQRIKYKLKSLQGK